MPVAAIHLAARKIDVAAIQRELDAGVAPDLIDTGWTSSAPLRTAINYMVVLYFPRKVFTDDSPASRCSWMLELRWTR